MGRFVKTTLPFRSQKPPAAWICATIFGIRLILSLEKIQEGYRELFREARDRRDFGGHRFAQPLDGTEGGVFV